MTPLALSQVVTALCRPCLAHTRCGNSLCSQAAVLPSDDPASASGRQPSCSSRLQDVDASFIQEPLPATSTMTKSCVAAPSASVAAALVTACQLERHVLAAAAAGGGGGGGGGGGTVGLLHSLVLCGLCHR